MVLCAGSSLHSRSCVGWECSGPIAPSSCPEKGPHDLRALSLVLGIAAWPRRDGNRKANNPKVQDSEHTHQPGKSGDMASSGLSKVMS